jgi:phosphatidylinositol alpha-1,6-mannosyltransferase
VQQVLMVSKPVAPPWTDSNKNLVRDLAAAGRRFAYRVLTPRGYRLPVAGVTSEPIYDDPGRYTPPLTQNLRVLRRLLRADATTVTHFFFAPNPRASAAARLGLRLRPRLTVQTVCSVPRSFRGAGSLLFARRVVVLSRATRQGLLQAGVDPARLVRIPPGIRIPPAPDPEDRRRARQQLGLPLERPVLVYPGDYQFSRAAETVALATAELARSGLDPLVVFACRIKQAESLAEERRIRQLLAEQGTLASVRMVGEVRRMQTLLCAADLCLLPAESLYAKMDLPLVLLEALALGTPLVVAQQPPLSELLQGPVGEGVPPQDPGALAAAVTRLLGNPDRLARMRLDARQLACRNYDILDVARRHEHLYQQLIDEQESHG